MTRRERMLHKTLNDDAIVRETRNRAAIVLQRLFRAHRKGNIVLQKPIITVPDDTEEQKCRRVSIGAKGFCPIIHCSKVLQAITDFRKLRIQNLFVEDNMTDMVDIGIAQNNMALKMEYMQDRMETIEDKLDKLIANLVPSDVGEGGQRDRGSKEFSAEFPVGGKDWL